MVVSFAEWLSESRSNLTAGGKSLPTRVFRPLYYLYVSAFLSATQFRPYGTNVYEQDWDTLIILDACRVDAMQEVADEYEFIESVDSIRSVGSTSFEWLNHTFSTEYLDEIQNTAYVTRNGYTDHVFRHDGYTGSAAMPFGPRTYDVAGAEDFEHLDELWQYQPEPDGDLSRTPPRFVSDRAIDCGRSTDADRMIIHYLYPHDPYPNASEHLQEPFDSLRRGDVERDEVWEAYLDNLRYVLDDVELLLRNLEGGDVVISADHGEAFGEYGFYRHVIGCPLPCMRRVPWVKTTATDTGDYEPNLERWGSPDPTADVEEHLAALGYAE